MTEFDSNPDQKPQPSDLHDTRLAAELRTLGEDGHQGLLDEAADRIDRYNRLSRLLGLLSPAGTAPRTALEQIYIQSADPNVRATPIVLDLQHMLEQHWGEWTPALREAEGMPPASDNQD